MDFKQKYFLQICNPAPPNLRQAVDREAAHGTGRALGEELEHAFHLPTSTEKSAV